MKKGPDIQGQPSDQMIHQASHLAESAKAILGVIGNINISTEHDNMSSLQARNRGNEDSDNQFEIDNDDFPSTNASNYGNVASYQVDPRTGILQLTLAAPTPAGFLGKELKPSISYAQQSSRSLNLLGLPLRWSYSYSYIINSSICINGSQIYLINAASLSEM